MNPYSALVGDRQPLEMLAEMPRELAAVIASLGPEGMQRSAGPGKWTAAQIVCHLADTEIAYAFRLRQTLAETGHVIQPFDQDAWAPPYASLDARLAQEVFAAVRRWNLALFATLSAEDFAKAATHPERGAMTFRTIVEIMAGHDRNHLRQLQTLAER